MSRCFCWIVLVVGLVLLGEQTLWAQANTWPVFPMDPSNPHLLVRGPGSYFSWIKVGLLIAIYLLWSLRYGPESTPNPWGSRGYEWFSGSPPAPHNFREAPRFEREVHDYTVPEAPRVY